MIPNAWRTDHDGWDGDDRPSPSDLAHEPTGRDYDPGDTSADQQQQRADATLQLVALQHNARRNWYPITRCDTWDCHTTVDLEDDPAALCDTCGLVTCDGCHHVCTGSAA